MNPLFPIYIVSKGRWKSRHTSKFFDAHNIPYFIIVEETEYQNYAAVIAPERVLILDPEYQRTYDIFEDIGLKGTTGPGAARNFAWDHAEQSGQPWHWVMDDNINTFYRMHNNLKVRVTSGAIFRCMEDFCLRYMNVGMAGPAYEKFRLRRNRYAPLTLNSRIYSCNLIRNDLPYRWRGRYNEDTDLSLRMLKDGWCTITFNAFLQEKITTQIVKGGNTAEFYEKEGTLAKSQMLAHMHPDVAQLKWKFNRWHHTVNYSGFKQKLIRKPNIPIPSGTNEYGMELVTVGPKPPPAKPFISREGEILHKLVQGSDVPGGHHCVYTEGRKPFCPDMKEARSIPLRHSDVVVDIGAFVGTFAIRAARFPVRKVVAYEPTPRNFEIIKLAGCTNLEVRQAAIVADDSTKEATFFIGKGYGPTNSLFESRNKERQPITVPCVSYAEAVRGATVVKIDIEGGEYDLPIIQPNVRAYIIDFHKTTNPAFMAKALSIIEELEAAGFEAVVAPKWSTGLDRAGSWLRPTPDNGRIHEALMAGEACCGCGEALEPEGSRAICGRCAKVWLPRHRTGFIIGREKTPSRLRERV